MLNIIKKSIMEGNSVIIRKGELGKERKNVVLARSVADIPEFLLKDGAVEMTDEGKVRLYAAEGPAERVLEKGVYICWEKVSEEKKSKVPGEYGAWPKDNGADTLKFVGGVWYDLPKDVIAVLLNDELPAFVQETDFPVTRKGNEWELIRTDWGGDVRKGTIGQALWCYYGPGDINILTITESSAKEYRVYVDGKPVCNLVDLF